MWMMIETSGGLEKDIIASAKKLRERQMRRRNNKTRRTILY